jgi:hypothetical protein
VPCTEEFPLCATNPYGRTKVLFRFASMNYYFFLYIQKEKKKKN